MPELVGRCLASGRRVRVFRHLGAWFDIGDRKQYKRATACFLADPERFLPSAKSVAADDLSWGPFFNSLVVTPEYLDERLLFIRQLALKTITQSCSRLTEIAGGAIRPYSDERMKAIEAIAWWSQDA